MKSLLIVSTTVVSLLITGCGSTPAPACVTSFTLTATAVDLTGAAKASGTANHSQAAPGNQQQYFSEAYPIVVSGQCAVPLAITRIRPQWTVSDTIDITISSANDATNGNATCINATLAPATVTATYTQDGTSKTASSTLTCQ